MQNFENEVQTQKFQMEVIKNRFKFPLLNIRALYHDNKISINNTKIIVHHSIMYSRHFDCFNANDFQNKGNIGMCEAFLHQISTLEKAKLKVTDLKDINKRYFCFVKVKNRSALVKEIGATN